MTKPRKQIHLAAHFPGVNNTTVWSDPGLGQPHRVRLVRSLRPDRRTRQVRLPVPRRGPAAARAGRQDLRPRRGRAAGHLHRAGRPGRRHRATRLDRHDQLDLQRAVRSRPAVRLTRPPLRGSGGVERGHVVGRLHRRELPPRRIPAEGAALRARRELPRPPHTPVRLVARRRDRGGQGERRVPADPSRVRSRAGRALRHRAVGSTCPAAPRAAR